MQYHPYPQKVWDKVDEIIALAQAKDLPKIAAFDADGTIWDTDLSDHFFTYQVEQKLLKNLPADPWAHFNHLLQIDPAQGLVWLAQVNAGLPIDTIRAWTQAFFDQIQPKLPIFHDQAKLIKKLLENDFEVYIITGSVSWVVEPAAAHFGIPRENVLGMRTEIVDGIISNKPSYPLTWQKGKPENLLAKTKNQPPLIAAGNTMGDFELLQTATHLQIVISSHKPHEYLYQTEQTLKQHAEKAGWLTHSFR